MRLRLPGRSPFPNHWNSAISGFGLPLALVLIRPDLDVWSPGEHNGTFRGHNLAFVTATRALDYWEDDGLSREVDEKSRLCRSYLERWTGLCPSLREVRGRGLILGVECAVDGLPQRWSRECFERGVIVETAGPGENVLKLLPPLTIATSTLREALEVLQQALASLPEGAALNDLTLAGGVV